MQEVSDYTSISCFITSAVHFTELSPIYSIQSMRCHPLLLIRQRRGGLWITTYIDETTVIPVAAAAHITLTEVAAAAAVCVLVGCLAAVRSEPSSTHYVKLSTELTKCIKRRSCSPHCDRLPIRASRAPPPGNRPDAVPPWSAAASWCWCRGRKSAVASTPVSLLFSE